LINTVGSITHSQFYNMTLSIENKTTPKRDVLYGL